jgi:hypothetical protein
MKDRGSRLGHFHRSPRPDSGKRLARLEATVDIATWLLSVASVALLVDLFSQWIG